MLNKRTTPLFRYRLYFCSYHRAIVHNTYRPYNKQWHCAWYVLSVSTCHTVEYSENLNQAINALKYTVFLSLSVILHPHSRPIMASMHSHTLNTLASALNIIHTTYIIRRVKEKSTHLSFAATHPNLMHTQQQPCKSYRPLRSSVRCNFKCQPRCGYHKMPCAQLLISSFRFISIARYP